ncbi:MAG: C39 family peptidase [Prolixibacteraceae bacterium]|nr:C39 family peptidase [Prolixibacteraceae bacterium]
MKAISQLFINLFIILSISLMASCLSFNTPDDPPNIDDIDFSGLIDDESYGESVTGTFTGDDLQLDFDNGTSFKLNATENKRNENQKVSVAIINDERFFNLEGDIVFDFSDNETEFTFDLEFSLPRNLTIDDITLCIYSKANSVDEMDAQHIAFTYDASKGLLKAKFRAPSDSPFNDIKSIKAGQNKKGRYDRLVISYVKFEESIVSRRLIPMPFYEQPGGTCWATCANMLSRAYIDASKTLRQPRIIDVVKSMGHQDLNSGVGLYDFKKVSGILKNTTFYDFETSSFFSSKSMLSHIINKIDKNIPVVLKFDYPNVGSHVILVVGYEINVMDNKPENTRLCYHDPRNDGNKGMYLVATYEWLMSQKSYAEVFQTLSAVSEPVPESKTLQTIGMPIFYDTQLAFANGHIGFYEESKFTSLPQVRLTYDKSTSLGYSWNHFKGNTLMTQIEDNASHIALSLPIYNASDVNKNLQLSIKAYSGKGENSTVVYETQKSITFEKKSTYVGFNENIPLSKIFAEENQEIELFLELMDNNKRLDYYTLEFNLTGKEDAGDEEDEDEEDEAVDFPAFKYFHFIFDPGGYDYTGPSFIFSYEREATRPEITWNGNEFSASWNGTYQNDMINEKGSLSGTVSKNSNNVVVISFEYENTKTINLMGNTETWNVTTTELPFSGPRNPDIDANDRHVFAISRTQSGKKYTVSSSSHYVEYNYKSVGNYNHEESDKFQNCELYFEFAKGFEYTW